MRKMMVHTLLLVPLLVVAGEVGDELDDGTCYQDGWDALYMGEGNRRPAGEERRKTRVEVGRSWQFLSVMSTSLHLELFLGKGRRTPGSS